MPDFNFDPEKHIYTLDGSQIESVTTVLREVGLADFWGDESHMLRGTLVHRACQLRLIGQLDESTVDPIVMPYLASFDCFLAAHNLEIDPWVSEVPTFHPILRYGMTPDFVGVFNGRRCLIDWQSGLLGTSKRYQTVAYSCNPNLGPIDDRFGLQLRDDGRYNLEQYRERSDVDVWYAALTVYRAQRRTKGIKSWRQ